jgi:flavin-binding protein dodecin
MESSISTAIENAIAQGADISDILSRKAILSAFWQCVHELFVTSPFSVDSAVMQRHYDNAIAQVDELVVAHLRERVYGA